MKSVETNYTLTFLVIYRISVVSRFMYLHFPFLYSEPKYAKIKRLKDFLDLQGKGKHIHNFFFLLLLNFLDLWCDKKKESLLGCIMDDKYPEKAYAT